MYSIDLSKVENSFKNLLDSRLVKMKNKGKAHRVEQYALIIFRVPLEPRPQARKVSQNPKNQRDQSRFVKVMKMLKTN